MVQVVVLFVAETWVLTEEISQKIKGVHVVFLRKLTGKDTRRLGYNSRRKLAAEAGGGSWRRKACFRRREQNL